MDQTEASQPAADGRCASLSLPHRMPPRALRVVHITEATESNSVAPPGTPPRPHAHMGNCGGGWGEGKIIFGTVDVLRGVACDVINVENNTELVRHYACLISH